jgi:hypothetical protein
MGCIYFWLVYSHIVHLWLYILLMGGHILENAQRLSCYLGVELKRETLGVLIYDCQLAVYSSTPIESLIPEQ